MTSAMVGNESNNEISVRSRNELLFSLANLKFRHMDALFRDTQKLLENEGVSDISTQLSSIRSAFGTELARDYKDWLQRCQDYDPQSSK